MKTPEQIVEKIKSMYIMLDSMQFHAQHNATILTLIYFKKVLDRMDDNEPYKEYKIKGIEEAIKFLIDDEGA